MHFRIHTMIPSDLCTRFASFSFRFFHFHVRSFIGSAVASTRIIFCFGLHRHSEVFLPTWRNPSITFWTFSRKGRFLPTSQPGGRSDVAPWSRWSSWLLLLVSRRPPQSSAPLPQYCLSNADSPINVPPYLSQSNESYPIPQAVWQKSHMCTNGKQLCLVNTPSQ